jgi:hypothetical protein
VIKPDPSSRHPIIVFFLILCVIAGAGILLGDAPAPGSLNATLPGWQVKVWSAGLTLGAGAILIGLWLQAPKRPHRLRDGVLFEQGGMSLLGPAAILYGFVAILQVGWSAVLPGGIVLGLGVACAYRWRTLQRCVNRSQALRAAQRNGAHGDAIH